MDEPQVQPDHDEHMAAQLEAALSKGDSALFLETAKAAAWARVVSQVSARLGLPRQQVANMLNGDSALTMNVAMRLISELQMRVGVSSRQNVKPASLAPAPAPAPTSPPEPAAYVRRF